MKDYVKDLSNSLDSNRERVTLAIFLRTPLLKKMLLQRGNEADNKTIISNDFFVFSLKKINQYLQHKT